MATLLRISSRYTAIAILLLALAAAAPSVHAVDANDRAAALATITPDELREHAGLLADDTLEGRQAGARGGRAAARYLETKLRATGLPAAGDGGQFVQRFNPGYQNLLVKIPGTDPQLAKQWIIVGAHYDHVGYGNRRNSNGPWGYVHNGADDNASGVAALLEVIDAMSRTAWQPRRSIMFAFWDGEEIDLLGSRHWVRQPTVPLADVRLAINADMVGRMVGGRLEVAGTRTGAGLRRLLSSTRLPETMHLDFTWEYEENSDHWPFFAAGVPSLLVHTGVHGDYHRPSDDVEKLNVTGMQQTAAFLLDAVSRLADVDELPPFRAASRSETQWTRRQREAPLAAAPPRLGLRWDWAQDDGAAQLTVTSVTPGSAAHAAGLQVGDRITTVDEAPIDHEDLLPAAVLRAEKEVTLEVVRGHGEPQAIAVTLHGAPTSLGISWREDSGAPGAVFVTRSIPYSPAARAGIAVHDRIYAIEGEPFANQDALLKRVRELLAAGANSLHLEVETAGRIHDVEVDLRLPRSAEDPTL